MIEIKDNNHQGSNPNKAYRFSVEELMDFFKVSKNAIYQSREHSKTQQEKKRQAEKNGTRFVTDKFDIIYAYFKELGKDNEDIFVFQATKETICSKLDVMLQGEKKYEFRTKEVK